MSIIHGIPKTFQTVMDGGTKSTGENATGVHNNVPDLDET